MKIVLDTNVLVSSLISTNTPPDLLYQAWENNTFELVTSNTQINELERVFGYRRLQTIIPPHAAQKLLETIWADAIIIDEFQPVTLSPDPNDNAILAIAVAGKVDLVVYGDKRHMLLLETIEDIPIVNARDALKWIQPRD